MGYKLVVRNYEFQFIIQVFTLLSVAFLLEAMYQAESRLKAASINGIAKTLAKYSWEIYLTQTLIIPFAEKIVFPINMLIVLCATAVFSVALKKVCLRLIP